MFRKVDIYYFGQTERNAATGVSPRDKEVLRPLAQEIAEIAALPDHAHTVELWRRLNDLTSVRPMVFISQLPWNEIDVNGELTLKTQGGWSRTVENGFRRMIYKWRHMRDDTVIDPVFYSPYVIRNTGYGLQMQSVKIPHTPQGGVSCHQYISQITEESDIDKIKFPELTLDKEATEAQYQQACDVFGDILDVKKQGFIMHCYAPWDYLTEWCNPGQILSDLALRPDFVHALIDRITSAQMHEADQLEAMGALSIDVNIYQGAGGMGYTKDLPCDPDDPPRPVKLKHQWGSSMSQIFSEVSPEMHEEFALAYEKRLLNRHGLVYYGCCEPLDKKVEVISRHLPKMRKISMSPWTDPERATEAIAGRYVYSAKPNPAFLATDGDWDRQSARKEIQSILDATEGKNVEVLLKDVSTVGFGQRRLWEWTEMAMEMVRDYEE